VAILPSFEYFHNISHDSRRLKLWSLQSQLDGFIYHYPGLIHGMHCNLKMNGSSQNYEYTLPLYMWEDKTNVCGQSKCVELGFVWFVANYATICLRLVVRIEELSLDRKVKVWQVRQETKHKLTALVSCFGLSLCVEFEKTWISCQVSRQILTRCRLLLTHLRQIILHL
jgi:hypothetical protein